MKLVITILALASVALASPALAAVDPVVGTTAIIGKDGDGSVCAATREKLKAAQISTAINDVDGFGEAMVGGASFDRGDRVLVIDNAVGSGPVGAGIDVRVRLLTGPNAHLACWSWQNTMHLQPAK